MKVVMCNRTRECETEVRGKTEVIGGEEDQCNEKAIK